MITEITIIINHVKKTFDVDHCSTTIKNIVPEPSSEEFDHILDILEMFNDAESTVLRQATRHHGL